MQIHSDDMIAARRLQHVGHEFGSYGGPRSVLFVLTRVGEIGDYGGDAAGGGGFAGVDYDEELHEAIVDVARCGCLEYKDCEDGGISNSNTYEGQRRNFRVGNWESSPAYHLRLEQTRR